MFGQQDQDEKPVGEVVSMIKIRKEIKVGNIGKE